jgi:four helix bundle protein
MHQRPYEKLIVWKEAHLLCLRIYRETKVFPIEERFSLVSQMRRAAYSVPMNIAEGNTKHSRKDQCRFIDIAMGSLEELHYQSLLAREIRCLSDTAFIAIDDAVQRVSYLLTKLRQSLH